MAKPPLDPKTDLTRLEDVQPDAFHVSPMTPEEAAKEPVGPDLGTLLGLTAAPTSTLGTQDVPDLASTATGQPPSPAPATADTEALLNAIREGRTQAPQASTVPSLQMPTATSSPPGLPPPFRTSAAGGAGAPGGNPGVRNTAMDSVREFSEQMSVGKELVPAAFPFSVMIDGHLAPEEKERLLDLLNRENMEIREMDLEPQFEEGRILIPRVSEFVGVLIVQALRSSGAQIRIGPADQIYSTEDTRSERGEAIAPHFSPPPQASYEQEHGAEKIPVTPDSNLPELGPYVVLDIVTASAALTIQAVEAPRSTEYQEMIDTLQKELRYKAWRKGASAILNFSVQLTQLTLPSRYRILVSGSAVRAAIGKFPTG